MSEYIEVRITSLSARVKCLEDSLDTITEMIAKTKESHTDQSTEEFVRVKHGHWIDGWICSECGEAYNTNGALYGWNYCPNCGAKMDDVTE